MTAHITLAVDILAVRDGAEDQPPAYTMLTTEPGPDVALKPEDWSAWSYLTKPEAELLRPLPAGLLAVEMVRPGTD